MGHYQAGGPAAGRVLPHVRLELPTGGSGNGENSALSAPGPAGHRGRGARAGTRARRAARVITIHAPQYQDAGPRRWANQRICHLALYPECRGIVSSQDSKDGRFPCAVCGVDVLAEQLHDLGPSSRPTPPWMVTTASLRPRRSRMRSARYSRVSRCSVKMMIFSPVIMVFSLSSPRHSVHFLSVPLCHTRRASPGFHSPRAPNPCAARPRAAGSAGGCPGRRDSGRSGREYTSDVLAAEYVHEPDGNRHSPRTARAGSVLIPRGSTCH
jgi:hypothetical protein